MDLFKLLKQKKEINNECDLQEISFDKLNDYLDYTDEMSANINDTSDKNKYLKNGDYVTIIKKGNSKYNYYKGYIGEIVKYKPYIDDVKILLPDSSVIIVSRDHFEKI